MGAGKISKIETEKKNVSNFWPGWSDWCSSASVQVTQLAISQLDERVRKQWRVKGNRIRRKFGVGLTQAQDLLARTLFNAMAEYAPRVGWGQ